MAKKNLELQHFAYALTHEFQESLRMVVNFTEVLGRERAGKLGEEADQLISYSAEGALRIEAVLKALLTPRIHVSGERDPAGWSFAGRDNGIGIDPQDAEPVFGMFRPLHGSEIAGAGTGLAICEEVAERQGGRIWVESTPGSGSTFQFTIRDAPPAGRQ